MGGYWFDTWSSVRVDNHVPRHAARHGRIERAIHSHRKRVAAREGLFYAAANSSDAEVVADDGNSYRADVADDRLDVFKVFALARAVEPDVVPVGGIEVL